MTERLWIVIVNYRTTDLAIECLCSLEQQVNHLPGGARVVIADNASGDDSVGKIGAAIEAAGWSSWAAVLPLPRNGGFAYGNNAGIRAALGATPPADYVMLLNPDTVVRPGALRALMAFMDVHPEAGIAGSLIENPSGSVDRSAHCTPSPLGDLEGAARLGLLSRLLHRFRVSPPLRNEAHTCDWVSGASMLIRRPVLEQIGMMDEGFFLYFEEVDFCCRARAAGWSVWYVPDSRVIHLEGAATGIRAVATRRPKYWYDSRRRFFLKQYGVVGLLAADILWAAGRLTFLLRRALRLGAHHQPNDPRWFMFDLLWGDLRALVTGQSRVSQRTGGQS